MTLLLKKKKMSPVLKSARFFSLDNFYGIGQFPGKPQRDLGRGCLKCVYYYLSLQGTSVSPQPNEFSLVTRNINSVSIFPLWPGVQWIQEHRVQIIVFLKILLETRCPAWQLECGAGSDVSVHVYYSSWNLLT